MNSDKFMQSKLFKAIRAADFSKIEKLLNDTNINYYIKEYKTPTTIQFYPIEGENIYYFFFIDVSRMKDHNDEAAGNLINFLDGYRYGLATGREEK